jgi:hypothetical protein
MTTLMVSKAGELNGNARLNRREVLEIHQLAWSSSRTLREIGEEFGVSEQTVGDLKWQRRWKHLWNSNNKMDSESILQVDEVATEGVADERS